jgi:hypothetical protein
VELGAGYFRLGEARSGSVHPPAPDPARGREAGAAPGRRPRCRPGSPPAPRLRTAGTVRHRPRPRPRPGSTADTAPSPGSPASHDSSSTARTTDARRPSPGRAHTAAPPPQPHRQFGGRSRRGPSRRGTGRTGPASPPIALSCSSWPDPQRPRPAEHPSGSATVHSSAAQIWIRGPPAVVWPSVLRFGHGISSNPVHSPVRVRCHAIHLACHRMQSKLFRT